MTRRTVHQFLVDLGVGPFADEVQSFISAAQEAVPGLPQPTCWVDDDGAEVLLTWKFPGCLCRVELTEGEGPHWWHHTDARFKDLVGGEFKAMIPPPGLIKWLRRKA